MMLPKEFFTVESMLTLIGASGMTFIVSNAIQKAFNFNPSWLAFFLVYTAHPSPRKPILLIISWASQTVALFTSPRLEATRSRDRLHLVDRRLPQSSHEASGRAGIDLVGRYHQYN